MFLCSDIIATGCNDKCVRVYYLATSIDKELKKFTGTISSVICTVYLCIVHTLHSSLSSIWGRQLLNCLALRPPIRPNALALINQKPNDKGEWLYPP